MDYSEKAAKLRGFESRVFDLLTGTLPIGKGKVRVADYLRAEDFRERRHREGNSLAQRVYAMLIEDDTLGDVSFADAERIVRHGLEMWIQTMAIAMEAVSILL